ncbi:uncharacterized protein TA20830 [Theileria annulata]|uniref:Uncharacterized protein n=1 Tax=Theileria annulata TaxID=5874 RepID=Q4UGY9_THEAN|nr:uncharacterized protein TA20830 [Theileria annulata]CAI73650.1 hypothetical protein TA20830 [Theileria annulata]|eukprot:XP_954327.1 hypothetical protein TA20830 [Theileria annulata]
MLILFNNNLSKLGIFNLVFVISIFVNYCESFLYNRNGNKSQLPLTHQFHNKIHYSINKCSPDSTNYIEDKSNNVIGLLCSPEKKIEIIKSIYYPILENKSRFSSLFYVTNSHDDLLNVKNLLYYHLNQCFPYFNGINIICNDHISFYRNANITVSEHSILSECLTNFGGVKWEEKALSMSGRFVKESDIDWFIRDLKFFIFSHFTNQNNFQNALCDDNLRINFDGDFLVPANEFIDSNFISTKEFNNLFNPPNTNTEKSLETPQNSVENSKTFVSDDKLVIFNNFSLNYDMNSDQVTSSLYDDLVLRLLPNCKILGLSNSIYNVNNVVNWLNSLSRPTKVVTLSKSPTFNILTKYGQINPFTTVHTTESSENLNDTNVNKDTVDNANTSDIVASDAVDTSETTDSITTNTADTINTSDTSDVVEGVEKMRDPIKMYDMFKKKNNKVKMTSLNPLLDDMVINSIVEALESRGISTYNQLITIIPSARNFFKPYMRVLRRTLAHADSKKRLFNLLKLIVNVRNNKFFSNFIKNFNLYPQIKQLHSPTPAKLVEYINEKGLFPTVIYCFNGTESVKRYFYDYVNKLGGTGLEDKSQLNLENNLKHFRGTDVVISNKKVEGAKHYIFLDTMLMNKGKIFTLSNEFLYSLTAGSDLVTFTVDLHTLFHNIKSLISPIYINYSNLYTNTNGVYAVPKIDTTSTMDTTGTMDTTQITEPNLPTTINTNGVDTINTNGVDVDDNVQFSSNNLVDKFENQDLNSEFGVYLKRCKEKYEKMYPDYFMLKQLLDDLGNRLKELNIDTFQLTQINSKLTSNRRFFRNMSYSIRSKLWFRGKLILKILKRFKNNICIIQGIDNQHYSTSYNFSQLIGDFIKRKLTVTKDEDCLLLKNVSTGNYIIPESLFLKDIISIGQGKLEYPDQIYPIIAGFQNDKLRTAAFENDLNEYITVHDPVIRFFGNEDLKLQKLSQFTPKRLMNLINRRITNYKEDCKLLMDLIYNNSNVNSMMNNDIVRLVNDYIKLDKKYKRRNLEAVIKSYQFKNTFYGK